MIRSEIASLISRVRPTALLFGVMSLIALILCIHVLMSMVADKTDMAVVGMVFGAVLLLAGTLGACAAKAFDDPPPPVVPAAIVEKIIDSHKR